MIKTVIRLEDDTVLVFDELGEQIPELQGRYEDVKRGIVMDAPAGTVFNHWFGYALKPMTVSQETW